MKIFLLGSGFSTETVKFKGYIIRGSNAVSRYSTETTKVLGHRIQRGYEYIPQLSELFTEILKGFGYRDLGDIITSIKLPN